MHIEGANRLLRTIGQMDRDLSKTVRAASKQIAGDFLSDVYGAASTRAESKAAQALRVYSDRFPKVGFSAGTRAGVSGGASMGEFFYGTEFGGGSRSTTHQFRGSLGHRVGYFFYPTLKARGARYAEEWFDMVMAVATATWNKGARI